MSNQSYQYQPPMYPGPPDVAPPQQGMTDNYQTMFGPQQGMLMRQKLRIKNLFACCLRNQYQVGTLPQGLDHTEAWDDEVFKIQKGHLFAHEHSETCDRWCCHRYRKFTMKVHAGDSNLNKEILRLERPFKCPIVCCCMMPFPQEIRTYDPETGALLGMTKQDWRCCEALCCKMYWKVSDGSGQTTYVIEDNLCRNFGSPSCCCEIHKVSIKDPSERHEIGSIENIFPGCTARTICCNGLIDNYRIKFPDKATPEDKANLFSAAVLIDYMLFSNAEGQQ